MSNRRNMNRTERRQAALELHLLKRDLEHEPTIYTLDEVTAAGRAAVESISDGRYHAIQQEIAAEFADSFDDLDTLWCEVARVEKMVLKNQGVVAHLGRFVLAHEHTLELERRVDALTIKLDAILAAFALLGGPASGINDVRAHEPDSATGPNQPHPTPANSIVRPLPHPFSIARTRGKLH